MATLPKSKLPVSFQSATPQTTAPQTAPVAANLTLRVYDLEQSLAVAYERIADLENSLFNLNQFVRGN